MNNELIIFPKEVAVSDYGELYALVVAQLAKDFHPACSMSMPPERLTVEWIFDETKRMLNDVIIKDNTALSYIIYRVDISEKTMRQAMMGLAGEAKMDALTRLIIKREAQKIWIRKNYAS